MKSGLLFGLLFIFTGLSFGQTPPKKVEGCVINGTLTGNYKANKVYLLEEEAINGASKVIDSAEVVNNRYTFKRPGVDVVKMYFIKSADPDCQSPITPFFMENGTIYIQANAEFFMNSKIGGTLSNEIFNLYNFLGRQMMDSIKHEAVIDRVINGEDFGERGNREFKRRTQIANDRYLQIQEMLVRRFYDQPFAPFMIFWEMKANVSQEKLKSLRTLVDPKLNEHPYTKQLDEFIRFADFKEGSVMPDFELPDQNGKIVQLKDFAGKYVLIDFWASWCGPCIREMPNVINLYKECKGKNFEIIGISLDMKKDAWIDAVKKNDMKWIQLCDLKGWESTPAVMCNVRAVPFTVLIDPTGTVVKLNLRGEELTSKVKEYIGKK